MNPVTIQLSEEFSEQLSTELRSVIRETVADFLKRYEKPWLPVREVAEMLDLSEKTIQNYRSNGKITFIRLDRKVYISREELDRFMNDHKINREALS